jgi:uncharacterized protein (DUF983 family)
MMRPMADAEAPPSLPVVVLRGIGGRCPWCGSGGLVSPRRWFRLPKRCPRCGLALEREAGAFLGSMVVSYTVTCLALVAVLGLWIAATIPEIPTVPIIAVGSAIVLVLPLILYPFSKSAWVAIDLLLNRMDREDRERFASELSRRRREPPDR